MKGKIRKVVSNRGFGFIEAPDGEKDIFFHCSDVRNGEFEQLKEGDPVSFDLEDGPKGKVAIKVTKTVTGEEEGPKEE